MAILNYTTKITANKTIGEISEILASNGAKKITMDYDDSGIPSSITFSLIANGIPIYFALPANYNGMHNAMRHDPGIPSKYCTQDQAIRTAWRVIKDWISAQCAIVQSGMVEMPEVFLPYAITKGGSTLYKEIKDRPNLLLGQ
jgi:hypothetical protein